MLECLISTQHLLSGLAHCKLTIFPKKVMIIISTTTAQPLSSIAAPFHFLHESSFQALALVIYVWEVVACKPAEGCLAAFSIVYHLSLRNQHNKRVRCPFRTLTIMYKSTTTRFHPVRHKFRPNHISNLMHGHISNYQHQMSLFLCLTSI